MHHHYNFICYSTYLYYYTATKKYYAMVITFTNGEFRNFNKVKFTYIEVNNLLI